MTQEKARAELLLPSVNGAFLLLGATHQPASSHVSAQENCVLPLNF